MNQRPMKYGSICSGIESATVAWHPLNWKPVFFSEIEKTSRAVLAHHYPDVPCHGDFTTIRKGDYEPIDLLVGGTPCQDFSVAGKRLGISAPRGNLALEFLALAARLRPQWLVFENVPGLLSNWSGAPRTVDEIDQGGEWEFDASENSDFAAFLGAVRECGYLGCWRSLDAQFAGLAQRRERLFFIGYLGDWRPPAAVLFERESLSGDSPPRREAGEGITGTLNARTEGGGGLGTDFECMGGLTAHTLRADGFDASEDGTGRGTPLVPMISPALKARDAKGPSSDGDGDGAPLIPIVIPILEAGARTGKSTDDLRCSDGIGKIGDPMFTLQRGKQHAVGVFDPNQITSKANRSILRPEISHTLPATSNSPIAFDYKASGRNGFGTSDISPTLRKMDGARANGGGHAAVAVNLRGREGGAMAEMAEMASLRASSGGSSRSYIQQMAVRRLTPKECEKLQGFEPNYTLVPYGKKQMADGPRYKMLGNSMAVPIMRKIGERIAATQKILETL